MNHLDFMRFFGFGLFQSLIQYSTVFCLFDDDDACLMEPLEIEPSQYSIPAQIILEFT